jgi:putative ABC transport system permease protein
MIPATWKKIFADLWVNKARSILATLSIAVGVFAVGLMISMLLIVRHDMLADYNSINPHTARIYTQEFDDPLLEALRGLPEVEAVDASYNIWLKIAATSGKLHQINLNSILSLDSIQVDQLVLEAGAPRLADGEIYLERQGAEGLGWKVGDMVSLTLANGQVYPLKLAGTVHDVLSNPYKFNGITSGFVTPATMEALGGSSRNNFVNLVMSGSHTDEAHVRQAANRIAEVVAANGIIVYNVNVQNPGQPPTQTVVDTFMALLGALTVLVVFLSVFLVVNTVSALMGQQIRQIGVMKAVGATLFQVMGIYLGLALAFGALALLIAIPLAALVSNSMTRWMIGMLNANPSPFAFPLPALGAQLFVGLLVPVFGAFIPVIGGARRTVRQAIANYGLEAGGKPSLLGRLLEALPWLSRPILLSLRNTFRRKGRLSLTLVTLILGGAIFIAILGVRDSMYSELDKSKMYFQSDVNIDLARPYPVSELETAVEGIPGVTASESWNLINANVVRPDGVTTDLAAVYVVPSDTWLLKAVMIAGRWLQAGDQNAIVVSNNLIDLRPDVAVGDTILLRLQGNDDTKSDTEPRGDVPFQVVGIFRISGTFPAPFTYITPEGLTALGGDSTQANQLKLATDLHTPARQEQVLESVQERFRSLGLEATLHTGSELIAQQHASVDILISVLVAMAMLVAVVGGLGLMGAMGMNVLERTREIGVLRSIGAENGKIFQMVLVEGLLIGLLSWAGSALAAIPITQMFDIMLGKPLMGISLLFVYPVRGLLIWLVIVLILSALASLLPARNAVRLTVRDVLAYE